MSKLNQSLELRQLQQQQLKQVSRAKAKAAYDLRQAQKYSNEAIWCAWFDGSAHPNPGACGAGVVLRAPDGRVWEWHRSLGWGNSSEAEYQALILALEMALPLVMADACQELLVLGDSRVVLDDVRLPSERSAPSLRHWHQLANTAMAAYPKLELRWLPRHRNADADRLSQRFRAV